MILFTAEKSSGEKSEEYIGYWFTEDEFPEGVYKGCSEKWLCWRTYPSDLRGTYIRKILFKASFKGEDSDTDICERDILIKPRNRGIAKSALLISSVIPPVPDSEELNKILYEYGFKGVIIDPHANPMTCFSPYVFSKEGDIQMEKDQVNHPSHYTKGIEVIDFIESWDLNFSRGSVIKYVARAGLKNPKKELEDLKKAQWYISREIERISKKENGDDF